MWGRPECPNESQDGYNKPQKKQTTDNTIPKHVFGGDGNGKYMVTFAPLGKRFY